MHAIMIYTSVCICAAGKLAVLVCNDTFIELKNDYEAEEENMGKYNKDFEDHRCRQPHGLHSQQVIASSSPYPSLLSSSPLSSLPPLFPLFLPLSSLHPSSPLPFPQVHSAGVSGETWIHSGGLWGSALPEEQGGDGGRSQEDIPGRAISERQLPHAHPVRQR